MLDGLRGVAAVLIVIFHHAGWNGPLPHAYLVVDFFFLLLAYIRCYRPMLTLKSKPIGARLRTPRSTRG